MKTSKTTARLSDEQSKRVFAIAGFIARIVRIRAASEDEIRTMVYEYTQQLHATPQELDIAVEMANKVGAIAELARK